MELAITAQIRNKALFEAVEKLGSQKALADHLEVSPALIGKWLNLKDTPNLEKNGKYWESKIGDKLFALTFQSLDEIFPAELREDKEFLKGKKKFTKFIDADIRQLSINGFAPQLLGSPEQIFEKKDLKKIISKILDGLSDREKRVIEMRFGLNGNGEHKLEEVAQKLCVTRERIRQIEAKALRRLRHPLMSENLKPFVTV